MVANSSRRTLIAASIGNVGEQYDFAVFGFTMPVIASEFFPQGDPVAALLSTFAIFAVGFLARPLGGLIFGYLLDKLGRVRVLALTIWVMAAGTGIIGLVPTYHTIGLAAPFLLVLCRLAQGAAFGGEFTGSTTLVLESAPDGKRARWVGTGHCFSSLPIAGVAIVLFFFQLLIGKETYSDWGWRIPFLLGSLIGVIGYFLRRGLEEPEEYKQALKKADKKAPLESFSPAGLKSMLHVAMVMPLQAVAAYFLIGYMYTYMVKQVGLDVGTALLANGAGIAVYALLCPFTGYLSDCFGRKFMMSAGAVWIALVAYLSLHMVASGSVVGALTGQVILAIGIGIYAAACTVTSVEVFPTRYRGTGHAIAYQLTVGVLGGTTPLICGWLVSVLHTPMAPAWYVTGFAVLNFLMVQFVPETKNLTLRTSVDTHDNDRELNVFEERARASGAGDVR
ncbi:major facilitator transporter [Caballeronia calidae]|uniref:Major facilitator transporter n=1 Tax=Caballeronia calidae TaxID=1777139 RepID=A0A158E494_9BURK|nr:MFS transporter [Caballeronia calidae]SAL01682.1 major facilitator transporter [Caballeronia calidae]